MITQFANNKLERIQLLLGVLLFCVFISYSLNHAFPDGSLYITIAIALQAVGVVVLMRQMMQNKTQVAPYFAWKSNKYKVLRYNYTIKILGFVLLGFLTVVHFYIDYKYKGEIMPLVYDYGIGGIVALALKFIVLERNWNLGLSDKGIIFGSKFDTKLIVWNEIERYEVNKQNNTILVYCKKKHPIKRIQLEVGSQLRNAEIILEQALSK